ncbi:RNA polymerase sigma factor [Kiloniella sp. b19]|uniref:RNA polymerase sigma factor n=1 Tax=Kiloniella sp. GXU_MW_B19 TaxID=3141326 RepID=UPI0031D79F5D
MKQSDVQHYYDSYGVELHNYLKKQVKSPQVAADLSQELFVRLLNSEPAGKLDNPRAYLFRLASNLLVDHFRKKNPAAPLEGADVLDAMMDRSPDPEQSLLDRERNGQIRRIVRELPARQREIITLHKFHEMSYAEIAERLGISKNTVMVHMVRALNTCRIKMGGK